MLALDVGDDDTSEALGVVLALDEALGEALVLVDVRVVGGLAVADVAGEDGLLVGLLPLEVGQRERELVHVARSPRFRDHLFYKQIVETGSFRPEKVIPFARGDFQLSYHSAGKETCSDSEIKIY